jgi:hypothetical protein
MTNFTTPMIGAAGWALAPIGATERALRWRMAIGSWSWIESGHASFRLKGGRTGLATVEGGTALVCL